jgi:hypothetical protein
MKGRFIAGVLIIALGLTGCGTTETAEAIVTTATTTAATFEMSTTVETTITAAETLITTTTAEPTTTTVPETTTVYIRDNSNDIAFSGEINADPIEYIKMLNISSGYGYMAFDDDYLYYAGNDDNENHASGLDNLHQIYKITLDGAGEPIALLPDTDELYYQKIRNIFVSDDRVYFEAIEMPTDFTEGSDNFFATIYSMNTDGSDIQLEAMGDFAQVFITDNKAYYYRDYLGEISPGFIECDIKTDEYRQILDPFGFYSLCTDDIILFYGLENHDVLLYDRESGNELFRMPDANFTPQLLFGDYLYSESGEFINIRTFERGTFCDLDDKDKIDGMNIYQNKLYFYVMTDYNYPNYKDKNLVSYDFSNGEIEETELSRSETPEEYEWWENFLYSTPAGLYSYDENGRIFCVLK